MAPAGDEGSAGSPRQMWQGPLVLIALKRTREVSAAEENNDKAAS